MYLVHDSDVHATIIILRPQDTRLLLHVHKDSLCHVHTRFLSGTCKQLSSTADDISPSFIVSVHMLMMASNIHRCAYSEAVDFPSNPG